MTYGWAILIISIVLVALWSIGVFSSPGGGGGAACVGTIGYLCGTPTLESNGLLLTTIGQTSSSGTLSVTGLGCSNSSMQPSTFYSASMTLPPSQATSASFDCPLPNSALGAAFTGTLWIQYNLGSVTGLVSRLGAVNTKVITQGGSTTTITPTYSFSATSSSVASGTVSCTPSPCTGNVLPTGTPISITATPIGSNTFSGWTGGTSCSGTTDPCTFTMPAGTDSETASFSTCYQLTLAYGTGGASATASPANSIGCSAGYFASAATITLTATPSTSYAFSSWTGTAGSSSSNPWTTFTMPANAAWETASFTQVIHYVPITINNYQSSGTSSNFQQMITVGTSYVSSGELSDMSNVKFTTGTGGTGTALQAWCESSCTSSSTSTWWVNLGADTMAASPGPGNSITIYMDFMPSSIMSSSGPTGEAPQIPGTYAQYDNGANIFNYYNDFISSSSLTGWNTQPGVGISANHGLTITSSGSNIGTESPYSLVPPFVYEAYGEAKVASGCIYTLGLMMPHALIQPVAAMLEALGTGDAPLPGKALKPAAIGTFRPLLQAA